MDEYDPKYDHNKMQQNDHGYKMHVNLMIITLKIWSNDKKKDLKSRGSRFKLH